MRRTTRLVFVVAIAAAMSLSGTVAQAQRGHPSDRHPEAREGAREARGGAHHVDRDGVVFVGGYFYDPFFGPYPWWSARAYPYPYYPVYDNRAFLRVLAKPRQAAVYVDGFYAGIVDDFDGFFQSLALSPGGHRIVLYLKGYQTVERRIYLSPDSTFKLSVALQPLQPGQTSEPPPVAPPVPPPPADTYIAPRTPSRTASAAEAPAETAAPAPGTLALRVQPPDAEVTIDGNRWASSDNEHYRLQLEPGTHHIEVFESGFQRFSTDVEVRPEKTTDLNVSLTPDSQ